MRCRPHKAAQCQSRTVLSDISLSDALLSCGLAFEKERRGTRRNSYRSLIAPSICRPLNFLRFGFSLSPRNGKSASGQILRHGWQADNKIPESHATVSLERQNRRRSTVRFREIHSHQNSPAEETASAHRMRQPRNPAPSIGLLGFAGVLERKASSFGDSVAPVDVRAKEHICLASPEDD
jgi:hypothetical protein